MKTIILGAGFTGMAAGIKTGAPIYEASEHAGGICRTYVKDGFEFDTGGPHWLFGNNLAIDFVRTLVPLNTYERNAGVYFNKILPYPIQNFLNKERVCDASSYGSFTHWLSINFSREANNMFFFPFNQRYTAGLMDEIIPFDNYKTPKTGTGWVNEFHNPVGGLNTLLKKMSEKCKIQYHMQATEIDTENKMVWFGNGKWVGYDKLISTIPLNQMMYMCGKIDVDLPFSSVFVLNIGAEPDVNTPKEHWLYIPFAKSMFHRLGFYSNVDSSKAPEGKVSLSVEIAFAPEFDYDDLDVEFITQEVVAELQAWRFIGKVITTDPTWVRTAYTWNRTEEERLRHIQWLKERDIITLGRYGTWKFGGLCESIQQGLGVDV